MDMKQAPTLRAVVFDLDGTLVDSLADIASAVNAALAAHGRHPHPLESYNTMIGWGLKQLLVTASADQPFSEQELEVAYHQVLTTYRTNPVVETRAYDGVSQMLADLNGRVPLGVFSNKEDGITKAIVATLFPNIVFEAVFGARPGKPHKPDPTVLLEMLQAWGVEPSCCAYLGDSDVDMVTAGRASVVACGAAWGFRGEEELRKAGANVVFSDPLSFGSWLEPLLERN